MYCPVMLNTLFRWYSFKGKPNPTLTQITNGTNYSVVNQQQIDDSYGIPHIYGGGSAWKHKKNLTVEVDYTLQKWSGVKYNNRTDLYQNRSKVAIGAEFLPKEFGRSYFSRIRYRAGA